MEMHYVPTTCPYCGTGCGLNYAFRDGKVIGTAIWHRHPVNEGKLCPRGAYAHEFINHKDRLKRPLIRREGELVESSWEEAFGLIAEKFAGYKPGEIGCVGSGRVTNEDNFVFQKFARAVLKTGNIDSSARLVHTAAIDALSAAFGTGAMTNSIPDIDQSKCILVLGSNTYEQHPLIARRFAMARMNSGKVIVADPRVTQTVRQADLHLPVISGTDVSLMNGIMQQILRNGWENRDFIATRTKDYDNLRDIVMKEEYSLDNVAKVTGVPVADIATAAEWIGKAGSVSLIASTGLTQHVHGYDNLRAAANLQMLTGNIGRAGTGVNCLAAWNNVQGACDMGCLPDRFPGYQPADDPAIREKFRSAWKGNIAGDPSGLTLTGMIDSLVAAPGSLKCMYIMGENPVLSLPDVTRTGKALESLEFLVVQDIFPTETTELADVVLPAASLAEKDGTQTNTERRVQRVRRAQSPPGDAKPDWQIVCELAASMGRGNLFPFNSAEEVFGEIRSVVPQYAGISFAKMEKEGILWPCPAEDHAGTPILHATTFGTPDGLGIFSGVEYHPPAELPDPAFPFVLSVGGVIFHLGTGTMTRRSRTLNREEPSAWIEIHSADAAELGIKNAELVRVVTRRGQLETAARVTDHIRRGQMFMPVHYSECPANLLTGSASDPMSGTSEYTVSAARVEKLPAR